MVRNHTHQCNDQSAEIKSPAVHRAHRTNVHLVLRFTADLEEIQRPPNKKVTFPQRQSEGNCYVSIDINMDAGRIGASMSEGTGN